MNKKNEQLAVSNEQCKTSYLRLIFILCSLLFSHFSFVSCSPKKLEPQPQTSTASEATEVQTQASTADFLIEGTVLSRYTGNGGHVSIPLSVTEIGEWAFIVVPGAGVSPTSVNIPSSVTTIGTGAFQNCGDLESVTFSSPSSVKVIGSDAFLGCGSLTSINIPSSVLAIGEMAFTYCRNLTNVSLSLSTRLENEVFGSDVQIHYRDFHIEYATNDILGKFDYSYYEYRDTNNIGDVFALWADIALNRFDFISIYYDYETSSWFVDSVLYSIDEWLSKDALLIDTYIGDGIPTRGISFFDRTNLKRYFSISEDGITNGVYHLREIYPETNG